MSKGAVFAAPFVFADDLLNILYHKKIQMSTDFILFKIIL